MFPSLLEELEKADSIDMRRKLAEAYIVAEQYDKAVSEMKRVAGRAYIITPYNVPLTGELLDGFDYSNY